jgi:Uncharacterized protein conserved in bacteria (DUF2188)
LSTQKAIHVLSDGEHDWVVREEGGREFGHYPTRQAAETVGYKLARKRGVELVVHGASGKVRRTRPRKGWVSRLFGR